MREPTSTPKETSCFLRRASAMIGRPEDQSAIPIQVEIGNSLSDAMCARKMTDLLHGFAASARRVFRQWRPFLLAIALLSCLGRATVALAQGPTWASIGPEGGPISALAIDPATPTTLYAGTYDGAFKS